MDLKEVQERLKYLNNVGHSVFPGEMLETTGNLFKQQLNSKLQGKFESICHEQSLGEFHYTEQIILQKDDELTLHVGERFGVKKRKREVIVDDKSARDAVADRCLGCRSVFVPGVTLRMRVSYEESKGKKEGKNKGQNRGSGRDISLECLCCGVVAVVKGAGMHNRLSGGEVDTDVSPGVVAAHAPLNTLPVPLSSKTKTKTKTKTTATATAATTTTTGSKSSKKRKKGGLGALLAAKRQKEAAGGAQAAFGLFGL